MSYIYGCTCLIFIYETTSNIEGAVKYICVCLLYLSCWSFIFIFASIIYLPLILYIFLIIIYLSLLLHICLCSYIYGFAMVLLLYNGLALIYMGLL